MPWQYIAELSFDDFCDILLRGKDAKEKDRLFFRWCLLEVHNLGEPISFKDYVAQMKPKPYKSTKDIMKEQAEIINLFNQGFEKVEI